MSKQITQARRDEIKLILMGTILEIQRVSNSLIKTDIDRKELLKIDALATLGNNYAKYYAEYCEIYLPVKE